MDWVETHRHNNEITCSFDVCSLFTNVPLDETIEICLAKLYSLPDPPSLPRHVLKDLLLFATKKSDFVFDGDYNDQIDGVTMASPLGPVLANISMCDFEEKLVASVDSRPSIWLRYVDHTFALFDNVASATRFLRYLKEYFTVIKHSGHLGTLEKCGKHEPQASGFYISLVFSNARRVLSQCNTCLRLLYSALVKYKVCL